MSQKAQTHRRVVTANVNGKSIIQSDEFMAAYELRSVPTYEHTLVWVNPTTPDLSKQQKFESYCKVGAPLDAATAVDFTEKYLLVFEEELNKSKDPESLVKAMKDKFSSAGLILAIERGAKANVKN
jgi:hypothetical protein